MVMDTNVPILLPEIVTHILKRLPVKSLIRFQSVCKDWKNLIKNPSFIKEHFHLSSNENSSLLLQWDAKCDPLHLHMLSHKMQVLEVQPSPLMDSLSRAMIVGCSNGLLCVKSYGDGTSLPSLLVWNPATRDVRQVPNPINLDGDFLRLGFGFSPIVNDFKILISYKADIDNEDNIVEVYSLSTGSWEEIQVEDLGRMTLYGSPVTANGAIFWFGHRLIKDDNDVLVSDWMVVSFDIAMEVFTLIPLPFDFNSCGAFLIVHENKLAILCINVIGNPGSPMTDLWVMEEGAGASGERWRWSKKYSISYFPRIYPRGIWLDKIVYFDYAPEYVDPESEAGSGMMNVMYLLNLSTHQLVNFASRRCGYEFSVTFNYAESLMPVTNIHH